MTHATDVDLSPLAGSKFGKVVILTSDFIFKLLIMCVSPIIIPSRKRYLSTQYHENLLQVVPCCHCSECKTKKQRELQFRFFYESQRSRFIYFDTLTYSDEFLPHVSDFYPSVPVNFDRPCFNRDHVKLFFKRLRRRLDYHYNISSDAFRYAIFSEYGADDRYTHRPHYHLIFFCYSDSVSPLDFSSAVGDCWQYGRTDGLPYKSSTYVQNHNILYENSVRLTNYITKYVCKSSEYYKRISPAIDYICNSVSLQDFDKFSDYKSFCRKVRSNLSQFTSMSKFVGCNYIDTLSPDDILQLSLRPFVPLPSNSYLTVISLPLYYVRKLFFKLTTFSDGSKSFVPNDLGCQYQLTRYNQIRDLVRNDLLTKQNVTNILFDVDSMVDYIHTERYSNCKPYLYLTPDELMRMPHVRTYYTDKDIDQYGYRFVFHSGNGNIYSYSKYIRQRAYTDFDKELLLQQLDFKYKSVVPESDKYDFITEFRNKHKHALNILI